MYVFTSFSASHAVFLEEYFLPSLKEIEPGLTVHVEELEQLSPTGQLDHDGFREMVILKLEKLWDFASSLPYNSVILVSDCDIQFFRPFAADLMSYMENYDVVFQTNKQNPFKLNSGFFCIRWNRETRVLISTVLSSIHGFKHDESALNWLMRRGGFPLRSRLLPPQDYWTHQSCGTYLFHVDLVPPDPIMHHANGIPGHQHKLRALEETRERVRSRRVTA